MRGMTAKMKALSTDSKEYVCCLLYSFFLFFSPLFFMIEGKWREGMRSYQINCLDKLFSLTTIKFKNHRMIIHAWDAASDGVKESRHPLFSSSFSSSWFEWQLPVTFFFSHRLKHRKQDNIRQENARSLKEEVGQEQRQVHTIIINIIIIIFIINNKKKKTDKFATSYLHSFVKTSLETQSLRKKEKSLCVLWMPTESFSVVSFSW